MIKSRLAKCVGIALICAVIFSLLFSVGFLSNIQLKLSDSLYGGKSPLDSIVIVAIDDKSLQELGRWPWDRDRFAEVVDFLSGAKVVGIDVAFFERSEEEKDKLFGEAIKNAGNVVVPVEYTKFEVVDGKVIGKDILMPIKDINTEPAGLGYVNIITDNDGISRSVNMDISEEYDNFAYVVYQLYWKKEIEKANRFLINFVGPPGSFQKYSFTDLVNERVDRSLFEDKLVLIGATAPDLHDESFVPTSAGKAMPGVEVHANTIQTMILKDFLQQQSFWSVILFIFISALLTAVLIRRMHILSATIVAIVLAVAYIFIAIYAFNWGLIMNLLYVPITIGGTYTMTVLYFYLSEKKSKRELHNMFGKYVSPVVIGEILKNPEMLKLGGQKREITVFFSDIRGFTSISEGIDPEKLVHVLNEYLTAMTKIVLNHQGVVDKYIGDAIMAFWGAPIDQPNHAELACSTAVDMKKDLVELRKKWKEQGFPEIKIGIGLNTGEAVIGNLGSYDRFDYTAIGDTINLGSRLEGITKQYGVGIVISETTQKIIKDKFVTRKLDLVAVKGKKEPIFIYELVGRKEDMKKEDFEMVSAYEAGLENYLNRRWEHANKEFRNVLKFKEDKAAELFIERC
ncbi:adenylate/guanylate cyclase domain-containing protein, partial [Candidatus Woesearchaeota archaeon]|nr:adenylate/guanylate cyclase domain-containing protein [Candidatus Woesearchaeota archaeon]